MLIDYKLCALSEHPEERALLELLDNYDYNYTMLIDCKLCSLSEHPGERALLDKLRQERQAFLRKHSHKGVKGGNSWMINNLISMWQPWYGYNIVCSMCPHHISTPTQATTWTSTSALWWQAVVVESISRTPTFPIGALANLSSSRQRYDTRNVTRKFVLKFDNLITKFLSPFLKFFPFR